MPLVTTDAIVVRTYNLAEADRIVVCLTRTAGLVSAVAKGSRRMKSRFGAALEPFTVIRLTYYEKENRELVTISSAEILKSHFNLNSQPEAAEVLAYMGELVTEFAPPHEVDERLFRMLTASVEALSSAPGSERVIMRYFEVWLLRLAGFFPDVRACSGCGATLADVDQVFLDADMKPHCQKCSRGGESLLTSETNKILRATQRLSPADFAASVGESFERIDSELGDLTHRLIVRTIER